MDQEHFELLKGIDVKVDNIKDKVHNIELVQVRIENDLKYHIKRTDLLEEKVLEIDEKIQPVENAKNMVLGFSKILAFVIGMATAIITIIKYYSSK